jgi:GH35 family endo-1,4-beta-xylanase
MGTSVLNRRQWLQQTGGVIAVVSALRGAEGRLKVRAFEPDGRPVGADRIKTLLLTDPEGQPYHLLPEAQAAGAASIELPNGKFEIMMILPVRDFGQVYLYADNGGPLYPPSTTGELLLNYEFARSRAAFVRRYVKAAQAEGVAFSSGVTERLKRGEAALVKASAAGEPATRAGHSNDSLADTIWAGERAAVERARHHIARNGPRPGFLFGCNCFGYAKSDEYARLYRELLNYGTVPFYRASTEKVEGKPDYSAVDAILEDMAGTGIVAKGHPLVWFHRAGIPEFLKTKSWAEIKQSCREYILRSVGRFRWRIHVWDVINEAHDWANELGFDQQQLLELTRLAADTTRVADPTAFRVVNSCCLWGEYAATGMNYRGVMRQPVRTPLQYYKALGDARVAYEAVGLQLYNPLRDMLEIERLVERFFVLGKAVHITELGVPSVNPSAPTMGQGGGGVHTPAQSVWHGTAWSQQVQADWVEQFYTICYSKPEVQAITWWDFADPAFIRSGGLVDENFQPKESYDRLKRLIGSWKA